MPNTPMQYATDKPSRTAAKKELANKNKRRYCRERITIRFEKDRIEVEREIKE